MSLSTKVTHDTIKINDYYVIFKGQEGTQPEQYVQIDKCYILEDGNKLYGYNYGYFGFHEGYCTIDKIRNLNKTEIESKNSNKFWKLPQQFYQSFPE
jgi:hypothetical protein